MLSVIRKLKQKKDHPMKIDVSNYCIEEHSNDQHIKSYWIVCYVCTPIKEEMYTLGIYSTEEKARKVFNLMIQAEEKQNSLIGTIRESDYWQDIALKTFEIFRMPLDSEVEE